MFSPDDSFYPLTFARFTGETTMDDAKALADWQDALTERARGDGVKLISLFDARGTTKVTAEVRRELGEWTKRTDANSQEIQPVTVVILDSALVRGAMTAIGWISSSVARTTPAKSIDEAVAVIQRRCREEGLDIPPGLSALKDKHFGATG